MAVLGVAAGGVALGVLGQYFQHRGLDLLPLRPSPARSRLIVTGTMAALLAFGLFQKHEGFKGRLGEVADAMRGLDVRPEAQILRERGYYEGLLTPQDDYARLLRGNRAP